MLVSKGFVADLLAHYRNKRVLVTGGLGFLGSNVAIALSAAGARVTVIDALTPDDGGNRANLRGFDDIEVVVGDIGDEASCRPLVERSELVLNLSGKVSHVDSVRDPLADQYANATSQLRLLEMCRHSNPTLRVVYTSTRQIYGRSDTPRVTEESPIRPIDPNGISKFSADAYHRMYARDFALPTAVLRLTNTYGPRQLVRHARQGFIPWFVRLALEGKEITVFGDGEQTRDAVYVDDAVDAILRVGALETLSGQVFNVGASDVHSVRSIAEEAIRAAGRGSLRIAPFPEDRGKIDIGSVACDFTALTRATGWTPTTSLRSGMEQMVAFYRERLADYL
jgi:nucleoside-diphosphate-sugar epimerase